MELKTALFVILGLMCLIFGLMACWWWLAHQMAWWTFATTGAVAWLLVNFTKAAFNVARKN